jgi:hypothetical protein
METQSSTRAATVITPATKESNESQRLRLANELTIKRQVVGEIFQARAKAGHKVKGLLAKTVAKYQNAGFKYITTDIIKHYSRIWADTPLNELYVATVPEAIDKESEHSDISPLTDLDITLKTI